MNSSKRLLLVKTVAILLIAMALLAYFIFPGIRVRPGHQNNYAKTDQSIAVLPFVNTGKNSSDEYFSDGLTDGIHNSLARLKGLKVCARTSSFKFKKEKVDIKEIGIKLGVGTVLEGTVQLEDGRMIITANLVNVKNNSILWSAKYDENMAISFCTAG